MNKTSIAKKQTQWLAGVVASIANVLLLAGLIGLANHYAQSGADVRMEAGALVQQTVTAANRNS